MFLNSQIEIQTKFVSQRILTNANIPDPILISANFFTLKMDREIAITINFGMMKNCIEFLIL